MTVSQCPWKSNFYISIKTTPQALLQRYNIIAVTLQLKKNKNTLTKWSDVSLKGTVHSKEKSVMHVIQNLYHFLCSAEHKCIWKML